jgi:Predicted metal-binding, possibly nucleic acid-binding protein
LPIEIEEEFFPTIDLKTGLHIDWSDDEDALDAPRIDEKHILDLTDVVRQELLVGLPLHPLCRLDCRGICPECGADRNAKAANAIRRRPTRAGPRWRPCVLPCRRRRQSQSRSSSLSVIVRHCPSQKDERRTNIEWIIAPDHNERTITREKGL